MFERRRQTVYEQPNEQNQKLIANVGKGAGIVVVVLLAIYLLAGSIYSLKENEYAVVTTFGVPQIVEESGIHLKVPHNPGRANGNMYPAKLSMYGDGSISYKWSIATKVTHSCWMATKRYLLCEKKVLQNSGKHS